MEASDKKGLRHLAKVTTSIVFLMIIEAIFLITYLRDDLNWMEYLQTSLGTLMICMLFVPLIAKGSVPTKYDGSGELSAPSHKQNYATISSCRI